VKRSRILKKENGILAIPDNKKGRKLSPEEEEIVKDFYLKDENFRVQPGMNDFVSVRIHPGEKKSKVQKQLLLMNIDELYYKYKEYCVKKLFMKSCGRSKFFALRSVNVIEVGASGSHHMMGKIVCDVKNSECMLRRCNNCSGNQNLRNHINSYLTPVPLIVKFQQWESTDRNMLMGKELSVECFVDNLIEKIEALTTHHFISKQQSKYCRELKMNLSEDVILLQGDFSQNYSMITQNSTQGSFFNPPPQATLHTFLANVKSGEEIVKHSMCVFSDCTLHNTLAVFSFLKVVIPYLRAMHTSVKKVIHFTDGAASQYKNCKNFTIIYFFTKKISGLKESGIFLLRVMAKGHAMALVKLSRRASLKNEITIQPLLPCFRGATQTLKTLNVFLFLQMTFLKLKSRLAVDLNHQKLCQERKKFIVLYQLTCFLLPQKLFLRVNSIPITLSGARNSMNLFLMLIFLELKVDNIIACVYLGKWYLGKILSRDEGQVEINVHFFKPPGEELTIRGFQLSAKDDVALVPLSNVIQIVKSFKKKLVVLEIVMLMKKN
jgi:hypothetical protein